LSRLRRHEQHPDRDNRGAFDFLTKPIDFGDLEMTIDQTIATSRCMARPASVRPKRARARLAVAGIFPPDASSSPPSADSDGMECIGAMLAPFSPILPVLRRWWKPPRPKCWARCSRICRRHDDVVFAHEGTVAKVIGDALQILFNAPGDQPTMDPRHRMRGMPLDAWSGEISRRWKSQA